VSFSGNPVLLTMPDYYGTLAAARDLGGRGISVNSAGSNGGVPTAKSRYVQAHVKCPKETNPDVIHDWLIAYGKKHPGTVLYPTSDDFAWLQATRRDSLEQHFQMYSPDARAIDNVLDKRRLFEACQQVGLDAPDTHFAENEADIERAANTAHFPMLLKQRTQVFSTTKSKGSLIHRREDLLLTYMRYMEQNRHSSAVVSQMPFASWPLIQEYYPDARAGNYLVSGFVNRDYTQIVTNAAVKVLQYPRSLGVALCLEGTSLDAETTQKILALCKATGYYGVFQVEFLVANGRRMLNDFNPRFYHYMQFDIARGMPLSWFAYLGACGEETKLASEMATARERAGQPQPNTFTCRTKLHEMIWAQRLTGTMNKRDYRYWVTWYKKNRANLVMALADRNDSRPEVHMLITSILEHMRHPRAFIRNIALDRTSF